MAQRLLITRPMPDAVLVRAERDYEVTANQEDASWAIGGVPLKAEGADAVITSPGAALTAADIEALPESVKIVAIFSVGFDHIDLDAAKKRGLTVTHTPDVLTDATADIAMLCLLGAARRSWEGQEMLRRGEWSGWVPTQLMGAQLSGHRLGVMGMGRIGQAVAKRARAFGLDVFRGEPALHPDYLTLPNAYLLPHPGSATVETRKAMGFCCLDNLDAFFAGKTPPNRIA